MNPLPNQQENNPNGKRLNSHVMGRHRELNQITTPKNAKHLRIPVMFLTHQVTWTNALVDSGASGNYMLTQFHTTLNRHTK